MTLSLHLMTFGKFPLGQIAATTGAINACTPERLAACLARHVSGDWGDASRTDIAANESALLHGDRIVSIYAIDPTYPCIGYGDNVLWIITESDRSCTTFLLPEEY